MVALTTCALTVIETPLIVAPLPFVRVNRVIGG
jgi:hypothetical protein